jgi:hypothetical protein
MAQPATSGTFRRILSAIAVPMTYKTVSLLQTNEQSAGCLTSAMSVAIMAASAKAYNV